VTIIFYFLNNIKGKNFSLSVSKRASGPLAASFFGDFVAKKTSARKKGPKSGRRRRRRNLSLPYKKDNHLKKIIYSHLRASG
jgi:hypothetical protein